MRLVSWLWGVVWFIAGGITVNVLTDRLGPYLAPLLPYVDQALAFCAEHWKLPLEIAAVGLGIFLLDTLFDLAIDGLCAICNWLDARKGLTAEPDVDW